MSSSIWNPKGLSDNCGFCAISFALEQQKKQLVTADQLYDDTLTYFGLDKTGGRDPVSRRLLFSNIDSKTGNALDNGPIHLTYKALDGKKEGLAGYTVSAVAERAGLILESNNAVMVTSILQFAHASRPGWLLEDFIAARLRRPVFENADEKQMASLVKDSLVGTSSIGSAGGNHFINLRIDNLGVPIFIDPQDNTTWNPTHAYHRLSGKVELSKLAKDFPDAR